MQKVHFCLSVLLIVAAIYGVFPEVVRSKCSLARELFYRGVPEYELSDWLCIARYASNYTSKDELDYFVLPDEDGTKYYGIFKISNEFWCESPYRDSENYCKMKCTDIEADDFSKAYACAKMIKNQAGFAAWTQWKHFCKEEDTFKPKFDECFNKRNVCTEMVMASDVP